MSEASVEYKTTPNLLQTLDNNVMLSPEQSRRMLARGLDELQHEAMVGERAALQWLNYLRALQGKPPVTVPKG